MFFQVKHSSINDLRILNGSQKASVLIQLGIVSISCMRLVVVQFLVSHEVSSCLVRYLELEGSSRAALPALLSIGYLTNLRVRNAALNFKCTRVKPNKHPGQLFHSQNLQSSAMQCEMPECFVASVCVKSFRCIKFQTRGWRFWTFNGNLQYFLQYFSLNFFNQGRQLRCFTV